MQKVRLIWVGKTQESFVKEGIAQYQKKLSHYVKVETEELRPARYNSGSVAQWRIQETESILKRLDSSELSVFLDEKGERQTSKTFSTWIEKQLPLGYSRMNLIIGGAFGFEQNLLPTNAKKIRLSDMTFTHQMVRIFLLEQLYRAFTIIRGESYHHDS